MNTYVDTSVFVAAVGREAGTIVAFNWLRDAVSGEVATSDWTRVESGSALAVRERRGELTMSERRRALALLDRFEKAGLRRLSITRADFERAAALVDDSEGALRAGAALHLAVALRECTGLATFDKRLAAAASRFGLLAIVPDQVLP